MFIFSLKYVYYTTICVCNS